MIVASAGGRAAAPAKAEKRADPEQLERGDGRDEESRVGEPVGGEGAN